ncbi:MAG: MjaI family restriction endonuclease [Candidatus Marinimicrobia bacterium]|nr:MjaI family restriction endonuclease [Candidatus Neomarinimicrobiota bacterium]MCH7762251.1 MjaI family restriction endonuclease [Candidatus Neomarinimicrobiota bacterium]
MRTKFKIKNDEIKNLLGSEPYDFPKYSTQILNLANQNAQGTRPVVVGQMSDLIQEFSGQTLKEWEEWYLKKHPDAIAKATEKVKDMVDNFREVIEKIDDEMINNWVTDLVIVKTFIGLRFQEAILAKAAKLYHNEYRLATPEEESKGIDGFIGDLPVSIKPESYQSKKSLSEGINANIIYYKKASDGITVNIKELENSM